METSSPLGTPVRNNVLRVSFGFPTGQQITPLKRGKHASKTNHVMNDENDDSERAERRRSAALQRSISETPTAGGESSSSANDSVKNLSEADLKSQMHTFSKLYSENRINVKNAWNIRVIDVLRQIVSHGNTDVLKVAGSSLDIAGKVYGLRVDDLHAEGLKLASSLARNFASKGDGVEENGENAENDPNNSAAQQNQRKKKQPKKRRAYMAGDKKQTIAENPKAFLDEIPRLESACFSARMDTSLSMTENLFTNRVMMDPAGYKFMLGSKELAWNWSKGRDPSVTGEAKFPISIPSVTKDDNCHLCAEFKDFQLDMWDPEKENMERKSNALDEVVLDEDGVPIAELDGSIHDVFAAGGNDDDEDDPTEEEVHVAPHEINNPVEHIVDFRPTECNIVSSRERSEYSFNNVVNNGYKVIDQIWAGPHHWKLKFIRNRKMIFSGRKEENPLEKKKEKKKGKKRKGEAEPIDLWKLLEEDDPPEQPAPRKRNRTNRLYEQDKFILPLVDPLVEKIMKNIEHFMTNPNMKPVSKKDQNEIDYQVADYNYRNPNDSLYCADENDNDHDDGGCAEPFDVAGNDSNNIGNSQTDDRNGFTGNNLVEAPEMVHQDYMHYATRAKKMDMKKLKQAVWCTLTEKEEYDESANVVPTEFSKMYKSLPKLLNESMRMDLSCPLAFVALLHLCNEQNLKLKKHNDISDFSILGPINI